MAKNEDLGFAPASIALRRDPKGEAKDEVDDREEHRRILLAAAHTTNREFVTPTGCLVAHMVLREASEDSLDVVECANLGPAVSSVELDGVVHDRILKSQVEDREKQVTDEVRVISVCPNRRRACRKRDCGARPLKQHALVIVKGHKREPSER
jgi:hypothetical protein